MHGDSLSGKALRDRITNGAEDRLGRALSDLFDSSFLSSAIGKAFDAREKAAQAQEIAMGALNLPSAADVERLTRRLRSVSQRLEGIEDGVHRFDRVTGTRLSAIEDELKQLAAKLESLGEAFGASQPTSSQPKASQPKASQPTSSQPTSSQPKASQPKASQPTSSQPKASQPKASQPTSSQPKASQPKSPRPKSSQSAAPSRAGARARGAAANEASRSPARKRS